MSLIKTTKRHLGDHASRLTGQAPTIELTDTITNGVSHDHRDIVAIRPPRESDGMDVGRNLAAALHHDLSILGESHTFSFTPVYSAGRITLYASAPEGRASDIRDAVTNIYPGATVRSVPDDDGGIPLPTGHYAAGARLQTTELALRPLKTTKSKDPLESDPHTNLLPPLVGADDEMALIQAVFRPLRSSWYKGGLLAFGGDRIERQHKKGKLVGVFDPEYEATDSSTRAAKDVSQQDGRDAFDVSLRILAVAPTRGGASQRVQKIAANLNAVKNPDTGQKLVPDYQAGVGLQDLIERIGGRKPDVRPRIVRHLRGSKNAFTDQELGDFLVHLPTKEDVQAPIEWAEQTESERIPADAY